MKKTFLIILAMSMLTACGQLSSGPEITETQGVVTDKNIDAIQYRDQNGDTQSVNVSVSHVYTGQKAEDILYQFKPKHTIPQRPDTSHLVAFQLSVDKTLPVEFTDKDGDPFKDADTDHGFCYALNDGWYAGYVPNGLDPFGVKIGNTTFLIHTDEVDNG